MRSILSIILVTLFCSTSLCTTAQVSTQPQTVARPDPTLIFYDLYENLYRDLLNREVQVDDGYFNCGLRKCAQYTQAYIRNSSLKDDAQWRKDREKYFSYIEKWGPSNIQVTGAAQDMKTEYVYGNKTMYDYVYNVDGIFDKMSADPNDDINLRWGLPELAAKDQLLGYIDAFNFDWYMRLLGNVEVVSSKCATDSGSPKCSPSDHWLKKYVSRDQDQNYRLLHAKFMEMFQTLSAEDQATVLNNARASQITLPNDDDPPGMPGYNDCTWNTNGICTTYDYLLSDKNLLQNISSNPLAPSWERLGFTSQPEPAN